MKNTLEFLAWFVVAYLFAWTGIAYAHPAFSGSASLVPILLLCSLVGLALLVAYEKVLSKLRLAKNAFVSTVSGHEGICFHYWGSKGFQQSGRRLVGPLYLMSGKPFLGLVDGILVKDYGGGSKLASLPAQVTSK